MSLFFTDSDSQYCCLCGDSHRLTGEHKIKASQLLKEFGNQQLYIGNAEDTAAKMKLAQSTKSKHFQFAARLCERCNTARTQASDREFDAFNESAQVLLKEGDNTASIFEIVQYYEGTEAYLNVFRFFAKLLCCHMADAGAPLPRRLANFAIGRSNHNCVWLAVQKDWNYSHVEAEIGAHQYAAHGGLVVYGNKSSGLAMAFHSTLTIGPLQYVFFMRIGWAERLELRIVYPRFTKWCRAQVEFAMQSPLSQVQKQKLGLEK